MIDTGARVRIITETVWKQLGKPNVNSVEKKIASNSCGIKNLTKGDVGQ